MKPEREAGMREQAIIRAFEALGDTVDTNQDMHVMGELYDAAYRAGAEAQRERDAQMVHNGMVPESFRKCQNYTEFERGGDNYLAQMAEAIRSAPIEGEKP